VEKQKESAEKSLEEARKRSADLQNQIAEEKRLRREAEQSLGQVKQEANERVAKVSIFPL